MSKSIKLSKKIVAIIRKQGFCCTGKITKYDDQYLTELNRKTPAGESWCLLIWFDGTENGFKRAIRTKAIWFDGHEEAKARIPYMGKNGIPSNVVTLLEDAEWKHSVICELADAMGRPL